MHPLFGLADAAALASYRLQAVAHLTAARALIANPQHWTQGCYARNGRGHACNVFSSDATCYCSIGALCKVTGRLVEQAGEAQPEMASLYESIGTSVGAFNDAHNHGHVLSMFDRAIAAMTTRALQAVDDLGAQPTVVALA